MKIEAIKEDFGKEKFDTYIDDLMRSLLVKDLPSDYRVFHIDSYGTNKSVRFQGVFYQGGFVIQAPLTVLKNCKAYQMKINVDEGEYYPTYTIWFNEDLPF